MSTEQASTSQAPKSGSPLRIIKQKLSANVYRMVSNKNESTAQSSIWQVFEKIKTDTGELIVNYVVCTICRRVFKFAKSIWNLIKHKCFITMQPAEEMYVQPVRDNIELKMRHNLQRIVLQWTIENCRPFFAVDEAGMKKLGKFIKNIGANFGQHIDLKDIMPEQAIITKCVAKLYPAYLEKLKTEVSSIRKNGYGLTIDVWSDQHLQSTYLFLIVHYVKNGNLFTCHLGLGVIEGATFSPYVIKYVTEAILKKFDCTLDDKVIIVTDNSNTMMDAFPSNDRIYCINHLLHCVLEEAIDETPEIRELFEMSTKLFNFLRIISDTFTIPVADATSDGWETNFHMLSLIADNWNEAVEISKLLAQKDSHLIENLSAQPITELLDILKNFMRAVKMVRFVKLPTLYLVMLSAYRFRHVCEDMNGVDTSIIKKFKANLLRSLDIFIFPYLTIHHKLALYLYPLGRPMISRYPKDKDLARAECRRLMQTYIDEETTELNIVGHGLSPLMSGECSPCYDINEEEIVGEFLSIFSEEDAQGASTIKPEVFEEFVVPCQGINNAEEIINNEIQLYERVGVEPRESYNPLLWWHLHRKEFPLLHKISCKIFAVPASSVAAEKFISRARPLIFESCNGDEDFMNGVLFLHLNVDEREMFYKIMDENF